MKWVLYGLALIGALSVAATAAVIGLAWLAHRADQRRQRRSRNAQIAQYIREGDRRALAADGPAWDRYVQVHGLDSIKTPKEWRR